MIRRLIAISTALALLSGTGATVLAQSQEGITVHGRWTIDVRNPDGSLAAHHEFNNALTGIGGARALAGVLGRFYRGIDRWGIYLVTDQVGSCDSNPAGATCPVLEYLGTGPVPLGWLSVVVPAFVANGTPTFPSSGTLELRAMTQFLVAANINRVESGISVCRSTACGSVQPDFYDFTAHTLSTPIAVAANQVVQVTVVFSFS